jgi:hypothetical protein
MPLTNLNARGLLSTYLQGKNYVKNPEATSLGSATTSDGASLSQNTTNPINYSQDFGVILPNNTSGYVSWTLDSLDKGLANRNCEFKFLYRSVSVGSQVLAQVYQGSNLVAQSSSLGAATTPGSVSVNVPCGNLTQTTEVRISNGSSNSGSSELYVDSLYYGEATNLGTVSQAQLIGSAYFSPTVGCNWSRTNTALGAFSTAASCPSITIEQNSGPGIISTVDADLPQITVSNLPPGQYQVIASFSPSYGAFASNLQFAISDGTTTSGHVGMRDSVSGNEFYVPTIVATFSYSTAGDRTFAIHGAADTGSVVINADTLNRRLNFRIIRFPSTSELAYRPDQVAWRVDANISGANPSLGTASVSSYTEITDPALALTQNSGSIATQIACASGTASSGTTCTAASESVGIAFTAPTAGSVLACANFTHQRNCNSTSADCLGSQTFQIVETTNTSSAIIQEGNSRIGTGGQVLATASFGTYYKSPFRVCGTFNFASAGQKTLRLMYEQNTGGNITASILLADAAGSDGQRDIHWEVYPITQSIPAPLLVGSVTSSSSGLERVERVNVRSNCTSSPCTINESTPGISSVTRSGTGTYTINFVSGTFSGIPTCSVGTSGGANVAAPAASGHSSTTFRVDTLLFSGVSSDGYIYATCQGPR